MAQCIHYDAYGHCKGQQMSQVDRDSPVRRATIDTGRTQQNGNPELSYHMIHDSKPIDSGLCFYHEQVRLKLIIRPNKNWRKW